MTWKTKIDEELWRHIGPAVAGLDDVEFVNRKAADKIREKTNREASIAKVPAKLVETKGSTRCCPAFSRLPVVECCVDLVFSGCSAPDVVLLWADFLMSSAVLAIVLRLVFDQCMPNRLWKTCLGPSWLGEGRWPSLELAEDPDLRIWVATGGVPD